LVGVGTALLGAGCALVEVCGATDVDVEGAVAGLLGHTRMTTGTATAADTAAISAIAACLVRYHGGGGALNVNPLSFDARSWPLTVQARTVGEGGLRIGGGGGCWATGWLRGLSTTVSSGAGSPTCSRPNHPSSSYGSCCRYSKPQSGGASRSVTCRC